MRHWYRHVEYDLRERNDHSWEWHVYPAWGTGVIDFGGIETDENKELAAVKAWIDLRLGPEI
jgi:hypothetical protein